MSEPLTCDVLVVGGGATGAGILRDLARRGLRALLVEREDFGTGTSGRYHGLLHSGGRYAARDSAAARECIVENRVLRRIAPASIEDTGGYFVATPDDAEDYVEAFPAACAAAGIDCDEIPVAEALRHEPALDPKIRRVFRLPDASIEPWNLIDANVADARAHGSEAWRYQRLIGLEREGERIVSATVADERSGSVRTVSPRFVVAAAGAWTGQIAAMVGVEVVMTPGKGVMLIFNQRMTDTIINRCHKSADGDIMVPVHTVAILGTTDVRVPDPDVYEVTRDEVEALVSEGEKLFPALRHMRLLRAYAGVRPLYQPPAAGEVTHDRAVSRAHTVLDHGERDGIENFVSVVGGKFTTFRLMAEDTCNVVCAKLGVSEPCTTADEVLPDQGEAVMPRGAKKPSYWLGHRLARHEAQGGGDAALLCECELVTRPELEDFLQDRWPCTIDDIRRGTRLGMGPCQGAFCTFRAAGLVAERLARGVPETSRGGRTGGIANVRMDSAAGGRDGHGDALDRPVLAEAATRSTQIDGSSALANQATEADQAMIGFLRERFKGTRPIAAGRQLQELWMLMGVYIGSLGLESLIDRQAAPAATEVADASR